MEEFIDRLLLRAATIDERLSSAFEVLPSQKADASAAAQRLAAWCRSCASGDWHLFAKRLARDEVTIEEALTRFASIRRKPDIPLPQWASDALWIDSSLKNPPSKAVMERLHSAGEAIAFEHLIGSVVEAAQERLRAEMSQGAAQNLTEGAVAGLCYALGRELSTLCAPALFGCFLEFVGGTANRVGDATPADQSEGASIVGGSQYDQFVSEMRKTGFRALVEAKPVLLRLISVVTRQWIQTTLELLSRLGADLPSLREFFFGCLPGGGDTVCVTRIEGELSDRHNSGRSVKVVHFSDGTRIIYKPKDLRLDAAWTRAVDRLNDAGAPFFLKAARVFPRGRYGWAEFVEHDECLDRSGFDTFFRRAGGWLCLFHLFAGTDMHEQNLIAAGDHPVPVDLEMLLQPRPPSEMHLYPEMKSAVLAGERIIESVTMTGLLPTYLRTPENTVVGVGGLSGVQLAYPEIHWECINTDAMKPVQQSNMDTTSKNLPRLRDEQAQLGDYVGSLISGFEAYAEFLCQNKFTTVGTRLFEGFEALPTRRVLRNTRFYYLLLERLKDHRNMADGVEWSAHLDFVARFSDWDRAADPLWPVLKSERSALAELCVPHFVSTTDDQAIADASGLVVESAGQPGLTRARDRYVALDLAEISWQVDIIRLSTHAVARSEDSGGGEANGRVEHNPTLVDVRSGPDPTVFYRVASDIRRYLSAVAVRSGPGASWIGLDWLGHSGICIPTALGDDLYSGVSGICVFLAAHANVTGDEEARVLSIAGMSALRHNLRSANGARLARALGIGGATGMGSVIYALVTMAQLLQNDSLLTDALHAASLVTEDLIAADWALDAFDGSAGCILGLVKLYEVTGDADVLDRAARCGDHLLSQPRHGTPGCRSWLGLAVAERAPTGLTRPLNGMSHGAAGFAYALASLAKATRNETFGGAAEECIAFENATFSPTRGNWPDFRLKGSEAEPAWVCQWCHGAGGIGLARIGALRRGCLGRDTLLTDILRSINCVEGAWPYPGDNMCCGNLGNIELLTEAGRTLGMPALTKEASRRLMAIVTAAKVNDEYLFDGVDRRFALGLFRGIAGIGYACLRQCGLQVPNVLIWE